MKKCTLTHSINAKIYRVCVWSLINNLARVTRWGGHLYGPSLTPVWSDGMHQLVVNQLQGSLSGIASL